MRRFSLLVAVGLTTALVAQVPSLPTDSVLGAQKTLADVVKGAPASYAPIIAGLTGPEAAKARFVLNGLAFHVSRPGAEAERAPLATALAEALPKAADQHARIALLDALRLCAKDESVPALAAVLGDETLSAYGVRALGNIGSPAATKALLDALGKLTGAAQANVAVGLGERRVAAAAGPLLPLATSPDAKVRAAALFALAEIGDLGSRAALTKAAEAERASERAQNTALLLRYATRLGENGQRDAGVAIARALLAARAQQTHVVCNCLATLAALLGDAAAPELLARLDGAGPALRAGLLEVAAHAGGKGWTDALKAKLATASAELKDALQATIDRREPKPRPALDPALQAKIDAVLAKGAPTGPEINVAQGKPVVESDDHQGDKAPELAVDGKADAPTAGWWAKCPATLTVNLKDLYRLRKVRVWFDWTAAGATTFTVETSLDNKAWTLVADQTQNTKPASAEGLTLSFTGTDARFVRLNVLKGGAGPLAKVVEFQAFAFVAPPAQAAAPPAKDGNLAQGKKVTVNRGSEGANTPERAVDGLTDNPMAGWFSQGSPAVLTVDLEKPVKIDTVAAWFHWEDGRYYQYTVEVSNDGEKFTRVVDQSQRTASVTAKGEQHRFDPVEARWVRINVTKNSANPSIHLIEFKVFAVGTAPAPPPPPVAKTPPKPDAEGFVNLLWDPDKTNWVGSVAGYELSPDGVLTCVPGRGGKLMTAQPYRDFHFKFEFQLTPGANNGVGIRAPLAGDAAYSGMEIQILDDRHEKYKGLHDYQAHGSVYGCVAAKRDVLKPVGEWNSEEIIAKGSLLKVIVNGVTVVDVDLAKITPLDGKAHPGLKNEAGHLGFLGHGDKVMFRRLRLKELGAG